MAAAFSPSRLIPVCPSCRNAYDCYRSPYALPCGHTFCAECLRAQPKKRCLRCGLKYRNFSLNVALKGMIENLQYLDELQAEKSKRCEECDTRVFLRFVRACLTCQEGIKKIVQHDLLQCHICLECCVNRHNGHDLVPISRFSSRKSSSEVNYRDQARIPKSPRFYSTVIDLSADARSLPSPVSVQNDAYFSASMAPSTSSHYVNICEERGTTRCHN